MREQATEQDERQADLGPQARGKPTHEGCRHPPPGDESDGQGEEMDNQDEDKDQPADKPSPLKKTWVRVLIGFVVVLLLVAGCIWLVHWWTHGWFIETTNNAYLRADQVTVSAKVAGTVERVFVGDNEAVHADQPLVQLDDTSSRDRVAQALAQAAHHFPCPEPCPAANWHMITWDSTHGRCRIG
jgi:membrane fusion protein (multidrug efflux system)